MSVSLSLAFPPGWDTSKRRKRALEFLRVMVGHVEGHHPGYRAVTVCFGPDTPIVAELRDAALVLRLSVTSCPDTDPEGPCGNPSHITVRAEPMH